MPTKKQTRDERRERAVRKVEQVTKSDGNRHGHHREEEPECGAAAEAIGQPRHHQATQNGTGGKQHGGPMKPGRAPSAAVYPSRAAICVTAPGHIDGTGP